MNKDYSDDYKVNRRNEGARKVETVKFVNAHFTEAFEYKSYRLQKEYRKYHGHSSEEFVEWAKDIDFLKKSAAYVPFDSESIRPFLHYFRTAYVSKIVREEQPFGCLNIS